MQLENRVEETLGTFQCFCSSIEKFLAVFKYRTWCSMRIIEDKSGKTLSYGFKKKPLKGFKVVNPSYTGLKRNLYMVLKEKNLLG